MLFLLPSSSQICNMKNNLKLEKLCLGKARISHFIFSTQGKIFFILSYKIRVICIENV